MRNLARSPLLGSTGVQFIAGAKERKEERQEARSRFYNAFGSGTYLGASDCGYLAFSISYAMEKEEENTAVFIQSFARFLR